MHGELETNCCWEIPLKAEGGWAWVEVGVPGGGLACITYLARSPIEPLHIKKHRLALFTRFISTIIRREGPPAFVRGLAKLSVAI